ncbi:hypothetical protein Tsubulata_049553, partial [Turnera subulata]
WPISKTSYAQRLVRRIRKCSAVMAELVGANQPKILRTQLSWLKDVDDQSSAMVMILLAVQEWKTLLKGGFIHQIGGLNPINFPAFELTSSLDENHDISQVTASTETKSTEVRSSQDESGDDTPKLKKVDSHKEEVLHRRETLGSIPGWPLLGRTLAFRKGLRRPVAIHDTMENPVIEDCTQLTHISEKESIKCSSDGEDEMLGNMQEVSSSLSSITTEESILLRPGWPLLRKEVEVEELSVVQWVMSLPNRSKEATGSSQINISTNEGEKLVSNESSGFEYRLNKSCSAAPRKLETKLELVLKLFSSGCKLFSYEELKSATNQFSSENFLGEGGCSNVYKGHLLGDKPVAVKILKQYKEAWNDFSLEVEILSSLKHKNITPLIGVCIEDDHLVLVHDFLSKGSLEESLHGQHGKAPLPWKVRFDVALAIAEALNYLHNDCCWPVIHRDVKSSNILLSDELQPQLLDFGLAVWGPADSNYITTDEIVGTFGYIAPEYFMHGRVSDKLDVYSFGIVLLELLTGKRPIDSKTEKGQESLVKWAMPLLESGNLKELLDPKPDWDFDIVQMHSMVLVATLCIKQSASLRPRLNQILMLLKGEKEVIEWKNSYIDEITQSSNQGYDDIATELEQKSFPDFDFLDSYDGDATFSSSGDTVSTNSLKAGSMLKDYLLERQED